MNWDSPTKDLNRLALPGDRHIHLGRDGPVLTDAVGDPAGRLPTVPLPPGWTDDLWGLAPRFSSFVRAAAGGEDAAAHLVTLLSSALLRVGPSAGPLNPVVPIGGDVDAAYGLLRTVRAVLGRELVGEVPGSDRRPWMRLQQEMVRSDGSPRGAVMMNGPLRANGQELDRLGGPGPIESQHRIYQHSIANGSSTSRVEWVEGPATASVFIVAGDHSVPRPSARLRDRLAPVRVSAALAPSDDEVEREADVILALLLGGTIGYRLGGGFALARAGLCDMDELESWYVDRPSAMPPNKRPELVAEFIAERMAPLPGGFVYRRELVDAFDEWAGEPSSYRRAHLFDAVRKLGGMEKAGPRPDRSRGFGEVELIATAKESL